MSQSPEKYLYVIFGCFSLDPDGDPLCSLLMIDYYAIRSEQYEFLVRLYQEWEVWQLFFLTVKFLNFGTPEKFAAIYLRFKQRGQSLRVFRQKDANGIANSEDPDQTAPLGAVWSGSALFAQTYLSENQGDLSVRKLRVITVFV